MFGKYCLVSTVYKSELQTLKRNADEFIMGILRLENVKRFPSEKKRVKSYPKKLSDHHRLVSNGERCPLATKLIKQLICIVLKV